MNDRLYRSVDDRVLAGVAGGLAERMGVDPSIIRIVWALLIIPSGGLFLLMYIVMAIVVPEEDDLGPYAGYAPTPPAAGMAPPPAPGPAGDATAAAPPAGEAPSSGTPAAAGAPGPTASPGAPPMTAAAWRAQARAARRAARQGSREPGQASIVIGVVLILAGVWFLLDQWVPGIDFDRVWPLALLALGVVLLVFSFGGRPGSKGPGADSR